VWDAVRLRFAEGAALVLASAAVLAVSAHTVPVYEIYKAGAELGWEPGLDLLGPAGLRLAFVPHWNNREGGADLDTGHCYLGANRFVQMRSLLPTPATVVGIDEQTALIVEPAIGTGRVVGRGGVTLERVGQTLRYERGCAFALRLLGACDWAAVARELPPSLRERARELTQLRQPATPSNEPLPPEVRALVERREEARGRRDWVTADALRAELAERGYHLRDTPSGPDLHPMG
jgi:hypothetical protein